MPYNRQLLALLADGGFHSGAALAHTLGVSRSAVWKAVHALSAHGVEVYAVPGRGYRLPAPLELLHGDTILAQLSPRARRMLDGLEVHDELDSTSQHLLRNAAAWPGVHACLAERQTAGRGRRGRAWLSPLGHNIYLSVLWRFEQSPASLGGLSLAAGVAVAQVLRALGVQGLGLKWPNDVVWQGRKLAGILLDLNGEASGPCSVVTGVGLNVMMPQTQGALIDQPWTDLNTILGAPVLRNRCAGRLLERLIVTFDEYARNGLAPFLEPWRAFDTLTGKTVRLQWPQGSATGRVQGVREDGALRLSVNGVMRYYNYGEVSVREAS
ncbi:MAG: bifunctional biotin--[acetyl-CoA-carboxylase] ligase/biotin operon repressor BirA [Gammaproteobacteria bacterium]|nr:MAG: bifunctional biotin--[acetyl-CoA-carboxylase] ligase/biotin operon repressor BirA [Gammaproteobacteria bacterium]